VARVLGLIAAFLRRSSKAAGSNSKFLTNRLKWDLIATVFCLQKSLLHGFAFEEVGRLAFGDDLMPEINRNNDTCRVPLFVGNILNTVLIHMCFPYRPYMRAVNYVFTLLQKDHRRACAILGQQVPLQPYRHADRLLGAQDYWPDRP